MRNAIMFLLGLVIGAGVGYVGFTVMANIGFDLNVPHLPR